jgi:Bacterial regulatory helix-turn-helix protein, lysR family
VAWKNIAECRRLSEMPIRYRLDRGALSGCALAEAGAAAASHDTAALSRRYDLGISKCRARIVCCGADIAMELHQIRYFLALCEELNFTRAAERCDVAQSSLTRAIKTLERELGGPLHAAASRMRARVSRT